MEKVVFNENKLIISKEELTSLLLKSWVRGANEGALYSSMKYNEDIDGIKQMNNNPNRLFDKFINNLYGS